MIELLQNNLTQQRKVLFMYYTIQYFIEKDIKEIEKSLKEIQVGYLLLNYKLHMQ